MKVGKAIYNILSQSTDVQSNFPFNTTDYSPTGTELVTNGDFSAGVEQLTQPIDLTTDFTANADATIDDSNSFTTTGNSLDGLRSSYGVLTVGKSYKLVIEGSTTSSGFTIGDLIGEGTEYCTGFGTHYFVAVDSGGGSTGGMWVRQQTAGTTDLTTFTIEELGGDWTVQEGWSIGEDKAICDGSTNNYVRQVLSLPVGNLKVTFEVDSYTSGTLNLWANLPAFTTIIQATSANTYEAYITTTSGANNLYFYSVAFVGSFTNVTVEEMVLNKIFPELAPPDIDAPYVVYSVVSNSPSETKNTNGDIDTANIEVYGFQDTYNKAVDLGVSVRAALDRKTGTYNTIEIQSTNYVNEQMDVNEARKLWAAIQDYSIRIKNI